MGGWSTSRVRNEHGEVEPHVFELGAAPTTRAPIPTSGFDVSAEELAQVTPPPKREPAQQPTTAKPQPPSAAPITGAALVKQLRARLRVVEREIKARQSLEQERDQLQRLLAAAKKERTNLRAIRAAG